MSDAHPKVQGRCPACGGTGLFLAGGGYITCARADCPDPEALADLLDRPIYHVLDVRDDGWQLQHAVTCFPELLDCHVHQAFVESPIIPPPGRYRVDADLSIHLDREGSRTTATRPPCRLVGDSRRADHVRRPGRCADCGGCWYCCSTWTNCPYCTGEPIEDVTEGVGR